ncbi:MAG TPA: isoprenylcysteine carboxylmethyltransferase family protein [Cyclobacteriaceae bacterium]|nr:isoprenylcysteine carboxylmethyltransferase family protein [Cyclobacteriaceae bacterium]
MPRPSLFRHLRDILLLPFTVTVIVPYLIINSTDHFIPDTLFLKIFAILFALTGVALLFYTITLFGLFGNGTLAPWDPTQKLVVLGPYRYVRNPMISGVFFILIGETLFFHSTSIAIWAVLFFFINTTYFILVEEPSLEDRFGDEYRQYKKHVGRWIPRVTPYKS